MKPLCIRLTLHRFTPDRQRPRNLRGRLPRPRPLRRRRPRPVQARALADPLPRLRSHVPRARLQPARGRRQAVRRALREHTGVLLSGGDREC